MFRKLHACPLPSIAMQAMFAKTNPSPTRVRVGVLCHGEQLPPSLLEGLQREVIEAFPIDTITLERSLNMHVLLLWLSPRTPNRVLQATCAWVANQEERVGLVGCAPNGDIHDTVAAFDAGVDDFVAGRCSVRELASRIRTLRGRLRKPAPTTGMSYAGVALDAVAHEAYRNNETISLSSTEVEVLRVLLSAEGRTLSRTAILDLAWGEHQFDIGERAVDNVILRLRRKLGSPGLIETVRGVGFRLASIAGPSPLH